MHNDDELDDVSASSFSSLSVECLGRSACANSRFVASELEIECVMSRNGSANEWAEKEDAPCFAMSALSKRRMAVRCDGSGRGNGIGSCIDAIIDASCASHLTVKLIASERAEYMRMLCPVDKESAPNCLLDIDKKSKVNDGYLAARKKEWQRNNVRLIRAKRESAVSDFATVYINEMDTESDEMEWDGSCALSDYDEAEGQCYVEYMGESNWGESSSCSEFTLSIYDPTSGLILSITCFLGSLFVFGAVNQTHALRSSSSSSSARWLNYALAAFVMYSFSAALSMMPLLQFEERAIKSLGSDDRVTLNAWFRYVAALNVICAVALLSFVEMHMQSEGRVRLRVRVRVRWLAQRIAAKPLLAMALLRIAQMLFVYIVCAQFELQLGQWSGGNAALLLALYLWFDVAWCWLSPLRYALASCCATWLLLSRLSPMAPLWQSMAIAQHSLLEVSSSSRRSNDHHLVWFDWLMLCLLFGFCALIACAPSHRQMSKVWYMFLQFFDFSTDITVVIIWLSAGLYLWASLELLFLVSCAMVQWALVRSQLQRPREHLFIVLGLARGYTKVRLWFDTKQSNPLWYEIDKVCTQFETFYESLPSLMLGLYLVCSQSSTSMGPLIVSVCITALTVSSKAWEKSQKEIVRLDRIMIVDAAQSQSKHLLNVILFAFQMTDFVLRCVPIVLLFVAAQGQTRNTRLSTPLMIVAPSFVCGVALAQWLALCRLGADQRTALRLALPAALTCTAMFFGCFGARGIPKVFTRRSFFTAHFAVSAFSALLAIAIALPLSLYRGIWHRIAGAFYGWLVCAIINMPLALFLKHKCIWFED